MSHVATVWAYQQVIGSPIAKLVLLALADQANVDGTCDPGYRVLREMTELSDKSIERHIRGLETAGLLSRQRRHTKDGRRTLDLFRLALGQAFIVRTGQRPPDCQSGGQADSETTSQRVVSERQSDSVTGGLPDSVTGVVLEVPSTSSTKERSPTPSLRPGAAGALFDRFWQAYPLKVGKRDARKIFDRLRQTTDPELIVVGAVRYRDDPKRHPDYTAHAKTWLNRGGWEDEYETPKARSDRYGS